MADTTEKKELLPPAKKKELTNFVKATIISVVAFLIGFVGSSVGINETQTTTLQTAAAESINEGNPTAIKDAVDTVGKEVIIKKVKEQITVKVVVHTVGSKIKDAIFGIFKSKPTVEEPAPPVVPTP